MKERETAEIMEALQRPFAAHEVEWRACRIGVTDGRPWALVHCHLTNRAIMNRLDEVFGLGNWRNEYIRWGGNSALCGLSIRINGEWLTKWDGASATEIAAVKGTLSDAMKRAAVQWGIGRYLYQLNERFAACTTRKPGGDNWHREFDRVSGVTFWWRPPALPAWALPRPATATGSGKNMEAGR